MTSPIPVIDLSAATAPDAPRELLDAVREATETVGIIQVVNHGVPESLISEFDERIGRLLALPRDRKAELASPTGHPYRGWRQWPDDFGRLELERFNVGQFDNIEAARAAGLAEEYLGLYAHDNVWPADDPELRDLAFRYIAAGRSLAEQVLVLYARAQGLPADTFPVSPLPYLSFTVNNYPTWTYPDTGNDEDKLLLLEHADGSAVTILAQGGDYEGLQVQLPDGDWLPVPIRPGALQVFSGSLLTRWTNGLLRPARHRVVAGGTATRRSVAIFYYPGLEQVLQPLAPFVEPGEETDYEPVTQWELVRDGVQNYLKVFGRNAQVTAWREGKPYVAELADNSAGR
ncbi:MAG TPA: 2OG-Fe(II) oxygenase family protein [Streptosporangiaceae bacterium]|nr:2OG-Fe(II) oxygenase family protein [Streptosporangiaceae bacterium]